MRKIVLHIGFPKSGSSALQQFLCRYPDLKGRAGNYRYHVLAKGKALTGKALRQRARFYPWGVVPTSASIQEALHFCEQMDTQDQIPVLSREAWTSDIENFVTAAAQFQDRLSLDIVVWIRPQVDWFQSSWWQWHGWAPGQPAPEDVFAKQEKWETSNWERILAKVEGCKNVHRIHTRLFQKKGDVVSDFISLLNIEDPRAVSSRGRPTNASLGKNHIRFYKALPWLRAPHRSLPDYYLMKVLPGGGKAPWVVSRDLAGKIIDRYRESNRQLLKRLPEDQQQMMRDDSRWWDVEAYREYFDQQAGRNQ